MTPVLFVPPEMLAAFPVLAQVDDCASWGGGVLVTVAAFNRLVAHAERVGDRQMVRTPSACRQHEAVALREDQRLALSARLSVTSGGVVVRRLLMPQDALPLLAALPESMEKEAFAAELVAQGAAQALLSRDREPGVFIPRDLMPFVKRLTSLPYGREDESVWVTLPELAGDGIACGAASEVRTALYAFWQTEEFPKVAGGPVMAFCEDGRVIVRGCVVAVTPLALFPEEDGKRIAAGIDAAVDAYSDAMNAARSKADLTARKTIEELLPVVTHWKSW